MGLESNNHVDNSFQLQQGLETWNALVHSHDSLNTIGASNSEEYAMSVARIFKRQQLALNGEISPEGYRALLTPVLFAGCGSTGTAAINGILRNGLGLPIFSDLDFVSESNLPRQANGPLEVDEPKAELAADKYAGFLPGRPVAYDNNGIQSTTIDEQIELMTRFTHLIGDVDGRPITPIIFDSVDVTTKAGWEAKMLLHEKAIANKIPVVAGFDIGGRSLAFFYDYQNPKTELLGDKVNRNDLEMGPQALNIMLLPKLFGFMPIPDVPHEYAQAYIQRATDIISMDKKNELTRETLPGIPQERIASALYEAVAATTFFKIVKGESTDIPEVFNVEVLNEGFREKLQMALLFITNKALLERAGSIENGLS